ncbi:FAD-dependent oxidoreductase [Chitinophaga horti]|uniref:FAD-dependent oxidoreductase n=1 Tax=Chitinophaga horti TaxID=2920382 RepID=A0ABY6J187_9BACT|nr:FAD-dependent oxidoreductase [Chitinophaga horti]UYQ91907.1 FAD-dependent oxidoreductase [Chitinophaga horti]
MINSRHIIYLILICASISASAQQQLRTSVLVVGGGTGGTAAGIQSARSGAATVIVESTPWLGGMLSSAGVSAIDGNHDLPSGLWNEFREKIYQVYGGADKVATGWVSHTQFEPHVADSILKRMAAAESNLTVLYGYQFTSVLKSGNRVTGATFTNNKGATLTVTARVVIDGTELGDVMAKAGAAYDLGMEAGSMTGEKVGITETNRIVQDLTYAAILKDYGVGTNKTIAKPTGYDPMEFDCSSTSFCHDTSREKPNVDAAKMLEYARLPNGKYLINWPKYGNDTYLNVVEMTPAQRDKELEKAKATTFRFIYFLQQELGFKHLGLADDEYPTADRLPLIPYHREGRRVKGLVRFNMRHIDEPFQYGDPLYRTGISVGDYPIDHHHKKNRKEAPQHLEFYPIPSFAVPMGVMIPQKVQGLIVAEKGISVSNVVNGTTRLQPCVLLTGQAAGVLAALSAQRNTTPANIGVREVQEQLLNAKAYLLPYFDVKPADKAFAAIQRVGVTGILKGKGVPYKWANQTWFYPDSTMSTNTFIAGLQEYAPKAKLGRFAGEAKLTGKQAVAILAAMPGSKRVEAPEGVMTRRQLAVLIDEALDPFHQKQVNINGHWKK